MTDLITRIRDRARLKSEDLSSSLYNQHPELVDRIPIMRILSDEVQGASSGSFARSARDYNAHVWVHKAVKVIADNIAPLRLLIVRGEGEEREPIDGHPIAGLLDYPNDTLSSADLWRAWTTDLLLGGEEGFELSYNGLGLPAEIWPRQPHTFTVVPGKGGRRYQRVDRYKISDGEGDPYYLKPEEFIHTKFYNPANPYRGIAPISAVRLGIVIDQLAQAWSRLFFRNSARPDYAVLTEEGLTAKERRELQIQLMQEHGGLEGSHLPIVLEQAVKDVKPLSFPPKDIEWLEQRKFSRDEIGAIFGVPDEIMGYGRDTYENFSTAFQVLWVLSIDPLLGFRDSTLSAWFRRYKFLNPDERIESDRTYIPRLPEDEAKREERAKNLFGMGYPANVINDRLDLGLPELEGGDQGYLPINLYPATSAPKAAKPGQKKSLKKDQVWAYGVGAPEFGSDHHKDLMARKDNLSGQLAEKMKPELAKFWQAQQLEISRRLRNSRTFGRGKFKGKAGEDRIPPLGELFDMDAEVARFEEEFGPIIAEAVRLAGEAELELLGLSITFDIDRPEVRAAIAEVLRGVALKTQQTVWEELIAVFTDAEAEGLGIPGIMEALSNFYGDKKSEYQLERIARTTMVGATNAGAMEGWDQTEGVVKERDWLSALIPDRTRDAHADAHGQRRGIREAFDVGGELLLYPGDPAGSPGNIINCLCATAPVVDKEAI